jgi:hypothetical protein
MKDHILNISLSGWLSAILFGVIFSIVFHKLNEYSELKAAKSVLKSELTANLHYMSYIYWEKYSKTEGEIARDIHYPSIQMINTYIPIIIKKFPDVAERILWLFSAFQEINRTKDMISTQEDEYDFFSAANEINLRVGLGIDSTELLNIMHRNFSIR